MKSHRKTASLAGILFLVAMAGSLAGAGILKPILNAPNYLINIDAYEKLIKTGVVFEFINALAVIGIAVLLYPVIKQFKQQYAVGYISLRILESASCFGAAIIPISILALGKQTLNGEPNEIINLQSLANFLIIACYEISSILLPLFFSLGALIFYTFLYQTKFLPRFLSIWGFTGVVCIIVLNVVNTESKLTMLLALPIILNEIFLGIWLIVKGFQFHGNIQSHNKKS